VVGVTSRGEPGAGAEGEREAEAVAGVGVEVEAVPLTTTCLTFNCFMTPSVEMFERDPKDSWVVDTLKWWNEYVSNFMFSFTYKFNSP